MRLFFALWPNAVERVAMAAWQPVLLDLCGGRVMRADTLHATLVFLGEVEEQRLEALRLAAQEVSCRAFGLNLTKAHYWGHNHIAYASPIAMPPQLAELVGELERSLHRHRFHFDARPYKPHVTLLRNAQWSDARLPPMPAVRWQIDDFALVRSLQDERGAQYEVLARFPLQETL
ncbi:2'-5'-RNA ligase [mine drainage metagenome]|uniref:2'-5'-RNA ligase n=1 Tax=mine drainage metagenome TaxID=410659 RepID=A0A1J5SBN5_9ZZZZ